MKILIFFIFLTVFLYGVISTSHYGRQTPSRKSKTIMASFSSLVKSEHTKRVLATKPKKPVKKPVKTPAKPAAKTPVKPAAKTPVKPAAKTPVKPVAKTPVKPVAKTPVKPVAKTPTTPKTNITILATNGTTNATTKVATNATTKVTTKASGSTPWDDCYATRSHFWDKASDSCAVCPREKGKRFAVFWETYADGCQKFASSAASQYVTHVYFSFAHINGRDGSVELSLQGNDQTLLYCVQLLRQKCIRSLISLGGADNRMSFLQLNSAAKLAKLQSSVAQLITKYTVDGVDIDDETGNAVIPGKSWINYSGAVINYIKALKAGLAQVPLKAGEESLVITWSEFATAARPKGHCDMGWDWLRCYNDAITPLVDWVNVMTYNLGSPGEFDQMARSEIPNVWAKRLPASKIVIGGCRGTANTLGACSYGATPSIAQLETYAKLGQQYGGVFLWTGSGDYTSTGGKVMEAMGKAGGYAHG